MGNWTQKDLDNLKPHKEATLFPTEEFVSSKTGYIEIYQELIKNFDYSIYIPGNVPSLKNSKRIMAIPTGKTVCCNAKYEKQPDILKEDGTKIRQYLCNSCGEILPILAKRASLLPSKRHEEYFNEVMPIFKKSTTKFIEMSKGINFPLYVGFYFIRKSRNKWDWDNAITTIMDIMRKSGFITEDDATIIVPVPLGWHYDKNNGGVVLTVLKEQPKFNFLWS